MQHWKHFLETHNLPDLDHIAYLSHLGCLKISGPDAKKLLQGQLTCNLDDITHTQSRIGAHCNPKGRMISLFRIFHSDHDYYLQMPRENITIALNALKKYAVFYKLELADVTDSLKILGYLGNHIKQYIQDILLNIPTNNDNAIQHDHLLKTLIKHDTFFQHDNLLSTPMHHDSSQQDNLLNIPMNHNDIPQQDNTIALDHLLIIKIPGNIPRYEIITMTDDTNNEITNKLNQSKLSSANSISPDIWESANIEAGLANIYPETSEKFLPHELNLHLLNGISFNKGCYTGQEIIARMHYRGNLKNKLIQTTIHSSIPPLRGEDLPGTKNIVVDYCKSRYNTYQLLILG